MLQFPELIAPAVQLGYFECYQVHVVIHHFCNLAYTIAADDIVQNFLVREGALGGKNIHLIKSTGSHCFTAMEAVTSNIMSCFVVSI